MNFKTSKITSRDLGPNGRDYAVALITAEGEHVVVGGMDFDTARAVAAIPDMLAALEFVRNTLPLTVDETETQMIVHDAIAKARGQK